MQTVLTDLADTYSKKADRIFRHDTKGFQQVEQKLSRYTHDKKAVKICAITACEVSIRVKNPVIGRAFKIKEE